MQVLQVLKLRIGSLFRNKNAQKWMLVGFSALIAFQLYFVREMLAALLLFTAVFLFLATIAFAVYLLDEGSRASFEWLIATSKIVSHFVQQSWTRVEGLTKKQIGRFRSAPAR